ncbi:MAG: MoaD/ThiS family protein [Desulfobacterales bacterium]|jgi:molybdopterin converting factor small subunit
MKVNLKCFATLSDKYECDSPDSSQGKLSEDQTVEDLIQMNGIAKENVKIIFVNAKKGNFDTVLKNGDQIGLAPAIGGM